MLRTMGSRVLPVLVLFASLTQVVSTASAQPPPPPGQFRGDHYRPGQNSYWFDVSFFYEELAPYGEWIDHPQFGWVWTPYNIPFSWRPYTRGQWVYSDCGWTWMSHEPFGWAVYHYGRWFWDPYIGWLWVPGMQWAPAWTEWRIGQGWVGWAPLQPDVGGWRGNDYGFSAHPERPTRNFYWNFAPARNFCDDRLIDNIVRVTRNVNLVRITAEVTHYSRRDSRIINLSFGTDRIQQYTRSPIASYRLMDRDVGGPGRPDPDRGGRPSRPPSSVSRGFEIKGNNLYAFRPQLNDAKATVTPRELIQKPQNVTPPRSSEAQRRLEVEKQALEKRLAAERASLERRQKLEKQRAPDYVKPGEIDKWHASERSALEEQREREMKLLERQMQRAQSGKTGVTPSNVRRYAVDDKPDNDKGKDQDNKKK